MGRYKDRPDTMISHGARESCEGGGGLTRVFFSRSILSADFKARFHRRPLCDHGALLGPYSTPSLLSNGIRDVAIQLFFMGLQSLLKEGVSLWRVFGLVYLGEA